MVSTIGQSLLLVALAVCGFGAPLAFVAGKRRSALGLLWVRRVALLYCGVMVLASVAMWWALLRHDFSVSYVAQVGSRATPTHITIVSLWSSLEGSILFWGLVLGLYIAALATLQRTGHDDYLAYALGTSLLVGGFFSFLLAGPANPFLATPPPIPPDGPGPNPLLQNHVLMIVHPPVLYLGYVGMTIPFAMAVAALLRGQLGPLWLRPLRNWLLVPTGFLTLGIMLGGWWSYEVLGWGGYWAWDPVENASFLPWLTAIAAVHSAVVQQRRGTLKAWSVILVIITFLLTILGTFLTRSGVVNSVHSFTQSAIGPLFLTFLGVAAAASVVLLALRVDTLAAEPGRERALSRESAFLLNNLVLVALMLTVLIGTLYPIAAEWLRGTKVGVGEPYFNRFAVPMLLSLLLLMGLGPALPWGAADRGALRRALVVPLPAAAVGLALAWLLGARSPAILATSGLAGFTLWVTATQAVRPARQRAHQGAPFTTALRALVLVPRRLGAYVVHLGVVVVALAIAVSATFQSSDEATLRAGESLSLGEYRLTFRTAELERAPHVVRQQAVIVVERGGRTLGQLRPSLNFYPTQRDPIPTPAVHSTISHDLYLTLQNVDPLGAIGLRAIITPAVGWIWGGVVLMVLGTGLCLVPPPRARAAGLPAGAAPA